MLLLPMLFNVAAFTYVFCKSGPALIEGKIRSTMANIRLAAICILRGSFCILNIVTPLGITNLRPFLGTIPLSLRMNTIFFKKIGRLIAKFLASNFLALDEL